MLAKYNTPEDAVAYAVSEMSHAEDRIEELQHKIELERRTYAEALEVFVENGGGNYRRVGWTST